MKPVLAVLVLALASGCICADPVTGWPYFCISEPSNADEAKIGARLAVDFTAMNGGPYPDRELHAYLQTIVIDKLASVSHRPELPWRFEVLNTSQINAFALPGGRVFVTRGLLAQLESEAQFAHLMGHEIGHVAHKHSLRGQGRNVLLGVLVGAIGLAEQNARILIKGDGDDPLILTSTAGALGSVAFLKFSRDQELQSDERGVDYAIAAGYDPREAVRTFARFQEIKEESGQSENLIAGLLSTHPLDSRRREAIADYIADGYPSVEGAENGLEVSGPDWPALIQRLKNAQQHYDVVDKALHLVAALQDAENESHLDEAETMLRGAADSLRTHAAPHVALAVVATQRDDTGEARRHVDRALGLDADHFEGLLLRGVLNRQEGRLDDAEQDLLAAAAVFPSSPLPCYQIGRLEEARKEPADAAKWYEMAIARSPRGSKMRELARERLDALGK